MFDGDRESDYHSPQRLRVSIMRCKTLTVVEPGKIPEVPVTSQQARTILGWSPSYLCAMRKASGIKQAYFDLRKLLDWHAAHPDFRESQVYPPARRGTPTGPRPASVDNSDAQLTTHVPSIA